MASPTVVSPLDIMRGRMAQRFLLGDPLEHPERSVLPLDIYYRSAGYRAKVALDTDELNRLITQLVRSIEDPDQEPPT